MDTPSNYTGDATTLVESTEHLEADGFTGHFGTSENATVICYSCHELSKATEVTIVALRRTEGASDPDDMTAIAAIDCPHCRAKGTLVVKYGPDASPDDADVLRLLIDARTSQSGGVSTGTSGPNTRSSDTSG